MGQKMTRNLKTQCDVLIIGAGIIGISQALALAKAGLKTTIIDRQTPERMAAAPRDGRASSISYGSYAMWKQLGVWNRLVDLAEPILEIRVSDGDSPFILHFDHKDSGTKPFGFMLENRYIRVALYEAANSAKNLNLLTPAEILEIERTKRNVVCRLRDGRSISAPLVIAADGKESPIRAAAEIKVLSWDYGQDALVCTVTHEKSNEGIAREHFLPNGPFALLPLSNTRSSLVWTEKRQDAEKYIKLSEQEFNLEILRRAGNHLGNMKCDSSRWQYPLGMHNAERYIGVRLALIGDAAHAMHPIAGQGLNLGLRDAAALAELIVDSARLGLDYGDTDLMNRYQRWRRFDALSILMMTDGLNRLFSNKSKFLRIIRGLGLTMVNRQPSLKQFFQRRAAAMSGDLPRLIRGDAL